MYALFDTIEQYQNKVSEIDSFLGYPNEKTQTITYAEPNPQITTSGKCALIVFDSVTHLFNGIELHETVDFIDP
jgi:hypothetical protein